MMPQPVFLTLIAPADVGNLLIDAMLDDPASLATVLRVRIVAGSAEAGERVINRARASWPSARVSADIAMEDVGEWRSVAESFDQLRLDANCSTDAECMAAVAALRTTGYGGPVVLTAAPASVPGQGDSTVGLLGAENVFVNVLACRESQILDEAAPLMVSRHSRCGFDTRVMWSMPTCPRADPDAVACPVMLGLHVALNLGNSRAALCDYRPESPSWDWSSTRDGLAGFARALQEMQDSRPSKCAKCERLSSCGGACVAWLDR